MPGESHALVGPQRSGQVDAGRDPDRPARADSGEVRFSGRAGAADFRPGSLASTGRLRLSAFDHHSRPHGRREPSDQSPADASRLHQLGRAAPPGARNSRSMERRGVRGHARRRPEGRGAPARRDRPRALVRRPLHHPRRADRAAGRRRDQAAVRPHARVAGAGRDVPLHLASPAGGLRDLPGGDGVCATHGTSFPRPSPTCRRIA